MVVLRRLKFLMSEVPLPPSPPHLLTHTNHPTHLPTAHPPTFLPTKQPANQATHQRTNQPTYVPANQTISQPSNQPTNQSTNQPTNRPWHPNHTRYSDSGDQSASQQCLLSCSAPSKTSILYLATPPPQSVLRWQLHLNHT